MIIPVRCFTCGKVIADKWMPFKDAVSKGGNPAAVLDSLGIKRYCCRRIFLAHVELIEESLKFSIHTEEEGKI